MAKEKSLIENIFDLFEKGAPDDKKVHALAEELEMSPHDLEDKIYETMYKLINAVGKHRNTPDSKFDKTELEMGQKEEMEHTDEPIIAKFIAKDHLSKIDNYYTRLKKYVEPSGEKEEEKNEGLIYIKSFSEFNISEAVSDDNLHIYKIKARDSEGTLKDLIEYIGKNGNTGHSFEIVVDPEMTKEEGKRSFYWDGDGSDYIKSVEVIQEPVKESINEEELWRWTTKDISSEWFNEASPLEIDRFLIGFNDGQGDHGFYTYKGIVNLLTNSDRKPESKELKDMTRTEIVDEFYNELDLNGNNSDMVYFDGSKYMKVHWKD